VPSVAATDDETQALQQEAIARAFDRWVLEYEDQVPFDPPDGGEDEMVGDYAEHQLLASASPAQLKAYFQMVQEELAGVPGD
jgi:hypothetical protein